MKWFIKGLKNYFVFKGRARRKEFWMWILFSMIFSYAIMLIDYLLGTNMYFYVGPENKEISFGIIGLVYNMLILIPNISIGVRRLHDINKSGWTLLMCLIPFAGIVIMIVFFCKPGISGSNKYGSDPKESMQNETEPIQ
jgi:uncharacterized membrane protein YhaH (DUF805 family)